MACKCQILNDFPTLYEDDQDPSPIWAAKGVAERPSAVWAHRVLASAYAHLGWLDEARHEVSVLLTVVPDATVSAIVNLLPNDPEYVARFADGLRMAGLPE